MNEKAATRSVTNVKKSAEERMRILSEALTILTVGLWGLVWLAIWLAQREKREIASVDEYGQTAVTPAQSAS